MDLGTEVDWGSTSSGNWASTWPAAERDADHQQGIRGLERNDDNTWRITWRTSTAANQRVNSRYVFNRRWRAALRCCRNPAFPNPSSTPWLPGRRGLSCIITNPRKWSRAANTAKVYGLPAEGAPPCRSAPDRVTWMQPPCFRPFATFSTSF